MWRKVNIPSSDKKAMREELARLRHLITSGAAGAAEEKKALIDLILSEQKHAEAVVKKAAEQIEKSGQLEKGIKWHSKRHNTDIHLQTILEKDIEKIQGLLLRLKASKTRKKEIELLGLIEETLDKAKLEKTELENYAKSLEEKEYDKRYIKLVKIVGSGISKALLVRPEGTENIPKKGPVMIASRHYHALYDYPILTSIVPRYMFTLSGAENFLSPLKAWVMKKIGAYPIKNFTLKDKEKVRHSEETLRQIQEFPTSNYHQIKNLIWHLQHGEAALIFPEGRAIQVPLLGRLDREFSPPKPGTIFIIHQAEKKIGKKIPIIPTGLNYKGNNVRVRFGKPFYTKKAPKENKQEYFRAEAQRLFEEIKKLSR